MDNNDAPSALRGSGNNPENQGNVGTQSTQQVANTQKQPQSPAAPVSKSSPSPSTSRPISTPMTGASPAGCKTVIGDLKGSTECFEYFIKGDGVQVLELNLQKHTGVICRDESVLCFDDGVHLKSEMNTGGVEKKGVFSKMFDASKAAVKGEKVFVTTCLNETERYKKVAFSSQSSGNIVAIDLEKQEAIFYRESNFLCASKTAKVAKPSAGESGATALSIGIKLNKLQGTGLAFLCSEGAMYHRKLGDGEVLHAMSYTLVAKQGTVGLKVYKKSESGKTRVFEVLTGPGEVWLQSAPFNRTRDMTIKSTMNVVIAREKKNQK